MTSLQCSSGWSKSFPQHGPVPLPGFLGCSGTSWTAGLMAVYIPILGMPALRCLDFTPTQPHRLHRGGCIPLPNSPAGWLDTPPAFGVSSGEVSAFTHHSMASGWFNPVPTFKGFSRNPCFHPTSPVPSQATIQRWIDCPTLAQPHWQLQPRPSFLLLVSPTVPCHQPSSP